MYVVNKPDVDYLLHFGVKGMKWGKRRKQQEQEYRQKLTSISKNKSIQGTTDEKLIKYRNRSALSRGASSVARGAAQMVIGDILSGNISSYSSMSKKDIAKKVLKIGAGAAGNMALNDALAKSVSKRYETSGKAKKGKKPGLITKEDAILAGVSGAMAAAPLLGRALGMKASSVSRDRAKNEARFNSFGGNILGAKVGDVVWQSSDFSTQVLNLKKR